MATVAGNAGRANPSAVVGFDLAQEMAAYDAMPAECRRIVREEATYKMSALEIRTRGGLDYVDPVRLLARVRERNAHYAIRYDRISL
jgi:hypothetical protein